jgi:cell division protein FtsI (penicillin-binding protein 3)
MIDNPRGVKKEAVFASDASAPVFKEIADKIYACDIQMHKVLDVTHKKQRYFVAQKQTAHTSDVKAICEEFEIEKMPTNEGWTMIKSDGTSLQYNVHKNPKNKVPDTRGMTLRDALYVLENKGFKVNFKGVGKVKSQSLPPGIEAFRNKNIDLILN